MLCCDTDSAIYVQNVDELPKVKTGDYLGHLKNGLEESGSGSFIKEFVSCGPKTMCFLFSAPRQENALNSRLRVQP